MSIRISYKIDKEHFIKHIKHIRGLVFVKNTLFGGFVEEIPQLSKICNTGLYGSHFRMSVLLHCWKTVQRSQKFEKV